MFLGMMRLPDMYCFLWGQRFSFNQSGISETSSRERTRTLSVLAIIKHSNLEFLSAAYDREGSGRCRVASGEWQGADAAAILILVLSPTSSCTLSPTLSLIVTLCFPNCRESGRQSRGQSVCSTE